MSAVKSTSRPFLPSTAESSHSRKYSKCLLRPAPRTLAQSVANDRKPPFATIVAAAARSPHQTQPHRPTQGRACATPPIPLNDAMLGITIVAPGLRRVAKHGRPGLLRPLAAPCTASQNQGTDELTLWRAHMRTR